VRPERRARWAGQTGRAGPSQHLKAMTRLLIIIGIILIALGLLWPLLAKLGIGNLPGDITLERKGFTFYFPLTTGLVISALISLILWIFRR
jgi:hypothetical protein